MKNKLFITLLLLLALIAITFCVKDDTLPVTEEHPSISTLSTTEEKSTDTTHKSVITATIACLSCTSVRFVFTLTYISGYHVVDNGICWSAMPNPTTEDNLGYKNASLSYMGDIIFHSYGFIDDLQPATLYHARPYLFTDADTIYGEDISFTTNSKPTILTIGVNHITATTALVIGNVTSTGGSFVVERGICYDTVPNFVTVIERGGFGLANHFIEQEVQSCNGAGEFTVNMTNLIPDKCYYVSTFVGVMTGFGYGDQIIEYGEEITFTTQPK